MKPQRVFYGRAPAPMQERYGRLEVLDRAEKADQNGEVHYMCRCDCGTRVVVRGSSLRARVSESCGCLQRELVAQRSARGKEVPARVGRLEVLDRAGATRQGEALYRCRCVCGTTLRVRSRALRRGTTQSCGCLQRERASLARRRCSFRWKAAAWLRGSR